MNKYYLVPVVMRTINCGGQSFFKILEITDDVLYKRELTRVDLQYSRDILGNDFFKEIGKNIENYNKVTSKMFRQRGVPEELIIVRNGNRVYELVTEKEVTVENPFLLEKFEVAPEVVVDIFCKNSNYINEVNNFLGIYKKKKVLQKGKYFK